MPLETLWSKLSEKRFILEKRLSQQCKTYNVSGSRVSGWDSQAEDQASSTAVVLWWLLRLERAPSESLWQCPDRTFEWVKIFKNIKKVFNSFQRPWHWTTVSHHPGVCTDGNSRLLVVSYYIACLPDFNSTSQNHGRCLRTMCAH